MNYTKELLENTETALELINESCDFLDEFDVEAPDFRGRLENASVDLQRIIWKVKHG